ncbi:hypothetical protein K2173_004622 [Erythroxylum novogranatense]|uniref:DNA polymerase delta subunit 3 n=1 Tax=Erythroxylum novogranatense TaxID=1862640 RepID=A0AAV8U887_9ROSI|nr:hypothetical protein K2173_004622 [Erythroxylum novogranatense]
MEEIETLGIFEEIDALISDKLQTVSYKWLSRNFLVSSNAAKRLLQEFVETRGSGLEVVYTLSGWLKSSPTSYHVKLVSGPKLEGAKQEFDGNCSVQVYSVQTSIPKDPAALWNTEFVQTEELFKQPAAFDNCLRDNRFCGVINSFVKRNVETTPSSIATAQPKIVGLAGPSKNSYEHEIVAVPPPQQTIVKQPSSEALKPHTDKEKVPPLSTNTKRGPSDKSTSGNNSSLANLWAGASTKSKPDSEPANNNYNPKFAETKVDAKKIIADIGSDGENQDVKSMRAANGGCYRKRRMVLDYSDDEFENAVSLASPEISKKQIGETFISGKPNFDEPKGDDLKIKKDNLTVRASNQLVRQDSTSVSKGISSSTSSEKIRQCTTGDDVEENVSGNIASNSPKRRKVLKTRIDERGREVTEVVWEGKESEMKQAESNMAKDAETTMVKNAEINAVTNIVKNRPPATKKSPAVGSTTSTNAGGKAVNKGGNKNPKQGNILSFFKRV